MMLSLRWAFYEISFLILHCALANEGVQFNLIPILTEQFTKKKNYYCKIKSKTCLHYNFSQAILKALRAPFGSSKYTTRAEVTYSDVITRNRLLP